MPFKKAPNCLDEAWNFDSVAVLVQRFEILGCGYKPRWRKASTSWHSAGNAYAAPREDEHALIQDISQTLAFQPIQSNQTIFSKYRIQMPHNTRQ